MRIEQAAYDNNKSNAKDTKAHSEAMVNYENQIAAEQNKVNTATKKHQTILKQIKDEVKEIALETSKFSTAMPTSINLKDTLGTEGIKGELLNLGSPDFSYYFEEFKQLTIDLAALTVKDYTV